LRAEATAEACNASTQNPYFLPDQASKTCVSGRFRDLQTTKFRPEARNSYCIVIALVQKMSVSGIAQRRRLAAAKQQCNTSTRKTFSGCVIHKIFLVNNFKSFLKSKKLLLINSTKVTSMSNFVDI
jgi:hypothetical protein